MTFKGPFQPKLFYDSMTSISESTNGQLAWKLWFTDDMASEIKL